MNDDEDDGGSEIPEWVVTFGDMMSLLLTFFIMLVSLSEIKEEEKYQAMVESVRTQFGFHMTQMNLIPGVATPRNNSVARQTTLGRSRKIDVMRGGNRIKAPVGERRRVKNVRTAAENTLDIAVYFDDSYDQLTDAHKRDLKIVAEQVGGKPQKLELRGHTTYAPVAEGSGYQDNHELAIHRCRIVMNYLVTELNIDPKRMRISSAGPDEPLYVGTNPAKIARNQRVEIRILDRTLEELRGTDVDEDGTP